MDTDRQPTTSKTKAGILLFVFCCLLSTGRMVFESLTLRQSSYDDVAKLSDQRFSALKTRLPASGVVGYIGHSGDSAIRDYYLTQYALAPLVVDLSPNHPIVVGNFPGPTPSAIPQNLRLVEDFGNGVMLLSHREPD